VNSILLKRGSKGELVVRWQKFLQANRYDIGPRGADGDFGFFTESATIKLQTQYQLGNQDGAVDDKTWGFAISHDFKQIRITPAPQNSAEPSEALKLLKPSDKGYQTILDFEVGGGQKYYDKYLSKPTLPGGDSGVTIGIGWDLRYNTVARFNKFWGPRIPEPDATALRKLCGFKFANKFTIKELSHIIIPWHHAEAVFNEDTIPRFWALTVNVFPGVELLPAEGQWAMLSLVFNRGGSLVGERRQHMQKIANILKLGAMDGVISKSEIRMIAECFRNMTSIWSGKDIYTGMYRRRNAEADLLMSCV
jgi:peptidoglycan hydrolase-like protein with peptidoglycan-binding domain